MENQEKKYVTLLPLWTEQGVKAAFNTNMQDDAPFVCTKFQQRSDLGECIISTLPPHFVARVRQYKTSVGYKHGSTPNDRQATTNARYEAARREYLEGRYEAWENGREAQEQGVSVRDLVEAAGMVYDEEFDEPRIVAKVPGLNVYLELFGCLDNVPAESIDWARRDGDPATNPWRVLKNMCSWAQNMYELSTRRELASRTTDIQPLEEWQENYDPEARPWLPYKRGIGLVHFDPSRRPELLHTHIPGGNKEEAEQVKLIRQANAENAARGIKPEGYGKRTM